MSEKSKPPIKYTYWPERGPNGTFEFAPATLTQMMARMRELGAEAERDRNKAN